LSVFSLRCITGKIYSIDNKTSRPARIFFAQGCEVEVENAVAEEDAPVPEPAFVRPPKRRR